MLGSNKGSQVDREAGQESEAVVVTFNEAQYATMSIAEQRQQLPVYKHRKLFFYPLLIFFALCVEGCDGHLAARACLWGEEDINTEEMVWNYRHRVFVSVGKLPGSHSCRPNWIWKNYS